MRFFFWQHMLNPHEAGYIKAISELGFQCKVIHQIPLARDRGDLGVLLPNYGCAEIHECSPSDNLPSWIDNVADGDFHFFTGINAFDLTRRAFNFLSKYSSPKLILISESRRATGIFGAGRILHSLLTERRIRRRIDAVLAMGELGAKWFDLTGYSKDKVFPFCYSINDNFYIHPEASSGPVVFNVAFVGQLVERKRVDLLIKAASLCLDIPLVINVYGKGELEDSLRRQASRLGVIDRIVFNGPLPNNRLLQKISQSDVLVLPSDWDGWGAVVNEALLVGTPCIVSDRCGASVLTKGIFGHVFKHGSASSLANAIKKRFWSNSVTDRNLIRQLGLSLAGPSVAEYIINVVNSLRAKSTVKPVAPWLHLMKPNGRVAIVYDYLPHYRLAVFKLISKQIFGVEFFAASEGVEGIKTILGEQLFCKEVRNLRIGPFLCQSEVVGLPLDPDIDCIVYLANPYNVTTWLSALLARVMGKRVVFWGHGFLSSRQLLRNSFRKLFYGLCDSLYVYGDRARLLGIQFGVPSKKIYVGFNSLDYDLQKSVRERLLLNVSSQQHADFVNELKICCISRITKKCRYDLLVEALRLIKEGCYFNKISVFVIGDGPVVEFFNNELLSIGVNAIFYGELYDEELIGGILLKSDMTVSPGKVGLTCMHSMAYGVPVVSHSNLDNQMPEVEAIISGVTGCLFEEGSVCGLVEAILSVKHTLSNRKSTAQACINIIERFYNAGYQVDVLKNALDIN